MDTATVTKETSPENPFSVIAESIKQSFIDLGEDLGNFLPNLIIAVIILCIGVFVAKFIRTLSTKILEGIKIDILLESTGIKAPLAKMGVTGSLATNIPKLAYYFIIVFMVKAAADAAGFSDVSAFIGDIFSFAPKLITAFLIMVVGMFVGDIIQTSTFKALDAKGLDYANTVSKIVFSLVFIVFLTVSLTQVGIETELLKDSVKILLAGVSIALALCLGLGLKDHARNIVAAVYVRDIFRRGTEVEIDGKKLLIMGVGPVTTKLQNDNGDFVILPNSDLITKQVNGKTDQA